MNPQNYQCIIFDCDGVLVDSEAITARVFVKMAREIGIDLNVQYLHDHFSGRSLQSVLDYLKERNNGDLPADFAARYRSETFELFKTEIQPVAGIVSVLEKVKVPICVASSGPQDKIRLNLGTTGLIDRFSGNIFSAYDIGSWKPNPDIFLHAASQMGFEPQDCAVIEDSLAGIIAARRGGFDVFGYCNSNNQKAFKEAGAITFQRMEELIDLLGLK